MFVVSVELLHGTFRGDPDGAANTGGRTRGEWPPSPARLFAALVAADGTGARCRITDGVELEWFERLPPPTVHADPKPWHQSLQPRFVVEHKGTAAKSTHLEYAGRGGVQVRPGVRVSARQPHVVYAWKVEPPPVATLAALRRRAARIGYLGASDSPIRVRVSQEAQPARSAKTWGAFVPDPRGDVMIATPAAGRLRLLDTLYDAWSEHGAAISRSQYPAMNHATAYRSPAPAAARTHGEVAAWLRLDHAVSGRRVAAVTALFKDAVLSRHQAIHGEPPDVLHGHGFDAAGYDIARYLALPDVGFPRSRGRIHGLALWMPPGCDAAMIRRAADAARAVPRLIGRGIDVSVTPRDDERRPVAALPDRWTRPARRWATAFPAVHERHGVLDLVEVTRWCRHAGLPAPTAIRAARTPLLRGAVDLAPVEVNRPGRVGFPYSHVELRFAEPIPGPVVIGRARQRGLGLCAPVDS